jgi:hypothetical protein
MKNKELEHISKTGPRPVRAEENHEPNTSKPGDRQQTDAEIED